jgi:hypothetical protein
VLVTGDGKLDNMAIVVNKKEGLSVEGKVTVIRQIENGKKKAELCRELCLINSAIQTIKKTEPRLLVHLNRMDRE